MLVGQDFDRFLDRALRALRPYLGDMVCVGGCANALYRFHEASSAIELATVGTLDLDLASKRPVPVRGDCSVAQCLEKAGFREAVFGGGHEPVVRYVPQEDALACEIEFLCPATGLPNRRGGQRAAPSSRLQDGLMGQPLQYLEILLHRPWRMDLRAVPGFESWPAREWVQVPNPAAYVMQKVLIRDQRRPTESMAKDCYYIFEVSVLFRDALDRLAADYTEMAETFPKKWFQRFEREARRLFASRDAEGAVAAMKVHRGIAPSAAGGFRPDEAIVAAAVAKMLERLFS